MDGLNAPERHVRIAGRILAHLLEQAAQIVEPRGLDGGDDSQPYLVRQVRCRLPPGPVTVKCWRPTCLTHFGGDS
jgi:hypothetical protein